MKSVLHKISKPLTEFEKANLMNIEDDYLGLYIPGAVDKNSVPSKWHLYYIQAGKTNITIMDDFPIHHFAGSLLLEHPYELKGIFSRKKLHSEDYAIIEPVDIMKYIGMESPSDTYCYADMSRYGYCWDGMIPVTAEDIKDILFRGVKVEVPVYVLNKDNTETLLNLEEDDFISDDKMYGIQKPDWYHHLYRADDEETEEEN